MQRRSEGRKAEQGKECRRGSSPRLLLLLKAAPVGSISLNHLQIPMAELRQRPHPPGRQMRSSCQAIPRGERSEMAEVLPTCGAGDISAVGGSSVWLGRTAALSVDGRLQNRRLQMTAPDDS